MHHLNKTLSDVSCRIWVVTCLQLSLPKQTPAALLSLLLLSHLRILVLYSFNRSVPVVLHHSLLLEVLDLRSGSISHGSRKVFIAKVDRAYSNGLESAHRSPLAPAKGYSLTHDFAQSLSYATTSFGHFCLASASFLFASIILLSSRQSKNMSRDS